MIQFCSSYFLSKRAYKIVFQNLLLQLIYSLPRIFEGHHIRWQTIEHVPQL